MTELEEWIEQATRHLAKDSAARVRTEIQQHYEQGKEAALSSGLTGHEAERVALTALGDAKIANRQYRRVLLTSAEARLLRDAKWEGRVFCSRRWLKPLIPGITFVALSAALCCLLAGAIFAAQILLVAGVGTGLMFAAPLLPVYTPARARIFRAVKWAVMTAVFWLVYGPEMLKWSWLLIASLWPVAWVEWQRFSIRRKLPVSDWPRTLYL